MIVSRTTPIGTRVVVKNVSGSTRRQGDTGTLVSYWGEVGSYASVKFDDGEVGFFHAVDLVIEPNE